MKLAWRSIEPKVGGILWRHAMLVWNNSWIFIGSSICVWGFHKTSECGLKLLTIPVHSHRDSIYSSIRALLACFIGSLNTPYTKNPDIFYSFSHKYTEFWLIKCHFRIITWRISCYDFKTILKSWEIWKLMLLNVSIAHIQPRICWFS